MGKLSLKLYCGPSLHLNLPTGNIKWPKAFPATWLGRCMLAYCLRHRLFRREILNAKNTIKYQTEYISVKTSNHLQQFSNVFLLLFGSQLPIFLTKKARKLEWIECILKTTIVLIVEEGFKTADIHLCVRLFQIVLCFFFFFKT